MDNRPGPGCLSGLLKLFLLDKVFDWLQKTFGYQRGGCIGCGCGTILMIVFVLMAISIIFGTNWLEFGF